MLHSKISKAGLAFFMTLLMLVVSMSSCKKDDGPSQAEIDRGLIEQYVADKQLNGNFTLSGLYYVIEEKGNGYYPYPTAVIKVSYKGYFLDDSVFEEGQITATPLNSLIPGWVEGVQLIDEGGRIKLILPSNLAYGDQAVGDIPANSVLVFDINLLAFEK